MIAALDQEKAEDASPHLVEAPRFCDTAPEKADPPACQVVVPGGGLTAEGSPPLWVLHMK